ncbi:hypothetical protein E1B28_000256 [Marasmius oreades]|uniref:Ubiquitin-like domain-containing protein n=1 Tax=Marasmius oreades TaxID=181124 RepID=A0A9P8AE97_9AGAR|nr:uncharacterized protein E1B28_000256 [Marasmius oreades]KAG7098293.1 hypothetical protein E1B28_000256 [Marasmius oreades]
MAEQAEISFIKTFVNTISPQPITYPDDYQQPPENLLSKVPVLQIQVPPPPARKAVDNSTTNESITLTFKSAKPAATFTLSVLPTDTIASIKSQLFESSSSLSSSLHAPPPDTQRLLLKGKALADNKLLKEYPIKAGDVVNLMVKPGFDWDPSRSPAESKTSPPTLAQPKPVPPPASLGSESAGDSRGKKHQRIPSVVLSPSPANDSPSPGLSGVNGPEPVPMDIELNIDDPQPEPQSPGLATPYHEVISNPMFWEKMWAFLSTEFSNGSDSRAAWEEFLNASKGYLTAHEIAKIRDHVGLVGMAGT